MILFVLSLLGAAVTMTGAVLMVRVYDCLVADPDGADLIQTRIALAGVALCLLLQAVCWAAAGAKIGGAL